MSGAEGQQLVADLGVARLRAWGVRRLFGHSGDGINTVLGALRRGGRRWSSSRRGTRRTPR